MVHWNELIATGSNQACECQAGYAPTAPSGDLAAPGMRQTVSVEDDWNRLRSDLDGRSSAGVDDLGRFVNNTKYVGLAVGRVVA